MTSELVICLFVKPPMPGHVKTRLAQELGEEYACQVYCGLVEPIISAIHAANVPLVLFFDGKTPEQLPESWRAHAVACCCQEGDGLGERMVNAFQRLFAMEYRSVLLCGSDIVGLDHCYLQKAVAALAGSGMVIAPARDGGYCLIGFTAEHFTPTVFEQICWSTDQVLAQTLGQCRQAGREPVLLDTLTDIDTLADLRQAAPDLFTTFNGTTSISAVDRSCRSARSRRR